ncbi:hypothetical protein FACS1894199_14940 [Bacteroidia bacterium]|nr:hypothetical protein FACS1894199_14940 [Bacteroidia bacterium]
MATKMEKVTKKAKTSQKNTKETPVKKTRFDLIKEAYPDGLGLTIIDWRAAMK